MDNKPTIRIGILDDSKVDLLQLENTLYKAAEMCNIHVDIKFICKEWEDFIKNYKSITIDACILDIEVNDKNVTGLDIAKAIDMENGSTKIIFLTGHTEYIAKAFSVSAFDFLDKPIKLNDIIHTLNRLVNKIVVDGKYLEIKTHDYIRIPYNQIIVIKYEDRRVHIITHKSVDVLPSTYTFEKVMKLIPNEFIECNSNICINMKHIRKMERQLITMDDSKKTEVYASKSGTKRIKEYIERGIG